jgi:hypothetical protein
MKALRAVVILHLTGVLIQAVLAGQFLSGRDGAVVLHERIGWAVAAIGLIQILLTIALRLPQNAALVLILSSAMIFLGEVLQVGTGYLRLPGVHIPLAILIGGGLAALAVRVFRT